MIKINYGMLGGAEGSFIGHAHRRAAAISNNYTLVGGAFSSNIEKSIAFAKHEGLSEKRIYKDVDELVSKELKLSETDKMKVVVIATPNNLHFYQSRVLLENGFHVICDKPVTITSNQALQLKAIIEKSGKQFCLTHTYTGYPMVRQMRELIRQGVLGTIQRIDVQYYQGWVNPFIHGNKSEINSWRLNPEIAGISSCMADIGVHAFNLVEYTSQLEVQQVLADLNKVSPKVELDLDGTVLLRFKNNIKGVLRSSQVANGEENGIELAIYGSKASLKWKQEKPNELYQLCHAKPAICYKPGNSYNTEFAKNSHTMPCGHPEGYYEAFANLYSGVAKAINGKEVYAGQFTGIHEGVRGMKFIEATVESNKQGSCWINV